MAEFVRRVLTRAKRAGRNTGHILMHYWRQQGIVMILYSSVHYVVQTSGATSEAEALSALRDALITALALGSLYALGVFAKQFLTSPEMLDHTARNYKQLRALSAMKITLFPGEVSLLDLYARRGQVFQEPASFEEVSKAFASVFRKAAPVLPELYEPSTREALSMLNRLGHISNHREGGEIYYKYTTRGSAFYRYIFDRAPGLERDGLITPVGQYFPIAPQFMLPNLSTHPRDVEEIPLDKWTMPEIQDSFKNVDLERNP